MVTVEQRKWLEFSSQCIKMFKDANEDSNALSPCRSVTCVILKPHLIKLNTGLKNGFIDFFYFRKLEFSIAIAVNFTKIISEKFEWCYFREFNPIFDFPTSWQKSRSDISTQAINEFE